MIPTLILSAVACGIRIGCAQFLISFFRKLPRPDGKKILLSMFCGVILTGFMGVLSMDSAGENLRSVEGFVKNCMISPLGNRYQLDKVIGEVVIINAVFLWEERKSYRKSLGISLYYEMIFWFWNYVFSVGIAIGSREVAFIQSGNWQGQIANILVTILLVVISAVFLQKKEPGLRQFLKIYTYVAVGGMMLVITFTEQSVIEIPADTAYMWLIIAVVIVSGVAAVALAELNKQYEKEKELVQLKEEQARMLEQEYTSLSNIYALNAKLFHDLHNHIGVLRHLLEHEKYGDAVGYLAELQAPVKEITDKRWTGDDTIDYLINSKVLRAEKDKIKLTVQVEFPKNANIKGADLCAIIGNLLDNAIEAAKQVTEEKDRFAELTIRRINQMLVIKVENSFSNVIVKKEGQLQTTKKEDGLHGFGIKSASTAAEKYDGTVITGTDGKIFRAVATLSFSGVEA